jgi:GT2 family glycosyltransferase
VDEVFDTAAVEFATRRSAASKAAFDEVGYTRANQDVADAVRDGAFSDGYAHYIEAGFRDGRPMPGPPWEARDQVLHVELPGLMPPGRIAAFAYAVDDVFVSPGGVMLSGWVDDVDSPVDALRIVSPRWRAVIDGKSLLRLHRPDVAAERAQAGQHAHGFVGFVAAGPQCLGGAPCVIELWRADGSVRSCNTTPTWLDDAHMRARLLGALAPSSPVERLSISAISQLEHGPAAGVLGLNRAITAACGRVAYSEHFGPRVTAPVGSVITCLYGKPEFLFLQHCLYAGLPGSTEYEYIVVSNSPDLADTLLRAARTASLVYGLDLTIILLQGNAGFGAANNVAARAARSNRLVFVNPDVFPKDTGWALTHKDIVEAAPRDQSRLFGAPLYYDDGTLMHGGMYFDVDVAVSVTETQACVAPMLRVQHYGKGAPPESIGLLRPRPVPAVTGAFMSCDRNWFETLGGFSTNYVFGHYEDADLCLKSWEQGVPPWIHTVRMWHLEGKGGTRESVHDAAAVVNRWLFSKTWRAFIEDGLLGADAARLQSTPKTLTGRRSGAARATRAVS